MFHEPIKNDPVARFYYKGTHSHPVRRTVLVIESRPSYIKGYELREGSSTRTLKKAPVKAYSRNKIATFKQLGASNHRRPGDNSTTLRRTRLIDLVKTGA